MGSQINGQFDDIGRIVNQSVWYSYPLDVQRFLPTILFAAQDPFVVRGFGNFVCTRESFIKVNLYHKKEYIFQDDITHLQIVKGGYSCFTMLGRFGKWMIDSAILHRDCKALPGLFLAQKEREMDQSNCVNRIDSIHFCLRGSKWAQQSQCASYTNYRKSMNRTRHIGDLMSTKCSIIQLQSR